MLRLLQTSGARCNPHRQLCTKSRLPATGSPSSAGTACSGWGVASGLLRPVKRVNHCVSADTKQRFDRVGFAVLECAVPAIELKEYARAGKDEVLARLPVLMSDTLAAVCLSLLGGAARVPEAPATPQPGNLPVISSPDGGSGGSSSSSSCSSERGGGGGLDVWLSAPMLHLPLSEEAAAAAAAAAAAGGGEGGITAGVEAAGGVAGYCAPSSIVCNVVLSDGGVQLSAADAAGAGAALANALRRARAGSVVVARSNLCANMGGVAAMMARGGGRAMSATYTLAEGADGIRFLSGGLLHADAVSARGGRGVGAFGGYAAYSEQPRNGGDVAKPTAEQLATFAKYR